MVSNSLLPGNRDTRTLLNPFWSSDDPEPSEELVYGFVSLRCLTNRGLRRRAITKDDQDVGGRDEIRLVGWEEMSVCVAAVAESRLGATTPVLLDCGSERPGLRVGRFLFRNYFSVAAGFIAKSIPRHSRLC